NCQRAELTRVVNRLLEERSIFVKDVSSKFADGKSRLRLAVRLSAENRILCQELAACLITLGEGPRYSVEIQDTLLPPGRNFRAESRPFESVMLAESEND